MPFTFARWRSCTGAPGFDAVVRRRPGHVFAPDFACGRYDVFTPWLSHASPRSHVGEIWIRLGGLRVGQFSFRDLVGVRDQWEQLMVAHFFPFRAKRLLHGVAVVVELLHKARPRATVFFRFFAGSRRMPVARRPAKNGEKKRRFLGGSRPRCPARTNVRPFL